jgi:oxygen-independent coproporphyrinogen-3 oxidase
MDELCHADRGRVGPVTPADSYRGPDGFESVRTARTGELAMGEFGVYLHIPFCAARCDYCAFATWADRHHLTARYLTALRREAREAVEAGMGPVTTVFVGGGTPSMVPPGDLMAVIAELPLVEGAEVTIECNPDTVTGELLDRYRAGGVTRVSLGVQSMVPHVLEALGRSHHPDNVTRAVALVRAVGFESFNLDLIHGAVGESPDDWRRTVTEVLALDPPHVSAYALTVEAGTPLADDPRRHPEDDDQADKYAVADELLSAAGLGWYEISNWSRSGHECRHNLHCWRQGDYRGLGCAAHSHRSGRRWWNVRTPERYIDAIESGRSAEAAGERLDAGQRRIEGLQLALRTRSGVPVESVPVAGVEALLEVDGGRLRLTREGRLLANEVEVRLR